jgi:hypothetical protein
VLIYNAAVSAGLFALAGADIVWWIAVTRLGSTACWFIFDWALHHPAVYDRGELPLPRPAAAAVERDVLARQPQRGPAPRAAPPLLVRRRPELPALARLLADERRVAAETAVHAA